MELILVTSDNRELKTDYDIITKYSSVIKNVFEDTEDEKIPVRRVDGDTMEKILEFVKLSEKNQDATEEAKEEDLKKWSDEFGPQVLFDLVMASNFLSIEPLMDHLCDVIAEKYVRGKPIEEVRATFGIVNDFTPEEEEEIQRQNYEWFE